MKCLLLFDGPSRDCTAGALLRGSNDGQSLYGQAARVTMKKNNNSATQQPKNSTSVKQGGKSRNATANSRKKAKKVRVAREPYWITSVLNPCDVRDARIPDGQMFPTATGQLRYMTTINGNTGYTLVNCIPSDVLLRPDNLSTVYNGWISAVTSANSTTAFGKVDSANNVLAQQYANWSSPPLSNLYPQMDSARVVSACLKLTFTGDSLTDGGTITGFSCPPGTYVGQSSSFNDEDSYVLPQVIATPGAVFQMPYISTHPLREGLEVVKVPSDKNDLEFLDAASSSVSPTAGIYTSIMTHGSIGGLIRWSSTTQTVMVEVVINYEYFPTNFSAGATRSVDFEPSTLSRVGRIASNVSNYIRPLVNVMGSAAVGTIRQALSAGIQQSSLSGPQRLYIRE